MNFTSFQHSLQGRGVGVHESSIVLLLADPQSLSHSGKSYLPCWVNCKKTEHSPTAHPTITAPHPLTTICHHHPPPQSTQSHPGQESPAFSGNPWHCSSHSSPPQPNAEMSQPYMFATKSHLYPS